MTGQTFGNSIVVETKNEIRFDPAAVADRVSKEVLRIIKKRTTEGLDVNRKAFAPYSKSYEAQLQTGGESTKVDLQVTRGMLTTIRERERHIKGLVVEMLFGPDTGTSEKRVFRLSRDKHGEVREKLDKSIGAYVPVRVAAKTGQRSPAHNRIGAWIHYGTAKMPARPWMGIAAPEDIQAVNDVIRRWALANQRR